MVIKKTVLIDATKYITPSDVVADFLVPWIEVPFYLSAQGRHRNAARYVDRIGYAGYLFERALNSVVYRLHQSRAELDR